jgi:uncharacterized protein YndB with AHSA1/START domain/uncharacterized damage-inducible protein DinB
MAEKKRTIKIKQIIQAGAKEVYGAFTHANALSEWLCNVAEVDAHEGGRLYVWWNSGYYASGEYITLATAEKIIFSWHGRQEPGITQVKINLKPIDQNTTLLSLAHSNLGSGKLWRQAARQYERGWKTSLENLKSVLESGIDLRFTSRPVLGLDGVDEVDEEKAMLMALPASYGLLVNGVVEGSGAYAAGLRGGDLLVKLAGKKLTSLSAFWAVMEGLQAGDTVKVNFYRGKDRYSSRVLLSPRPLPEIPASSESLADTLQHSHANLNSQLCDCLTGILPEDAAHKPDTGDWSVNETLSHLIAVERDLQSWISGLMDGQDSNIIFHTNNPIRLRATVSAFTTPTALLEELLRSEAETIALIRALPSELVARKGTFWRLGYNALELPEHTREHIQQICQALTIARENRATSVASLPQDIHTNPEGSP